jgi:hypothetical protein
MATYLVLNVRTFVLCHQVEELRSFYTKKLKESASRIEEAERKGDRCEELLRKNGRPAQSKKPVRISTLTVCQSSAPGGPPLTDFFPHTSQEPQREEEVHDTGDSESLHVAALNHRLTTLQREYDSLMEKSAAQVCASLTSSHLRRSRSPHLRRSRLLTSPTCVGLASR